MNSKKITIGVFASSISLGESVQRIAEARRDRIIIAYEGLEAAVPVGKKMERDGVEVIVSRRGTAHLLRENLTIPVLSLPQTSLNLMASLKKAVAVGKRILLPAFRTRTDDLDILEEMLGIELIQGIYSDASSLERVVAMGLEKGCDVVVGGGVTMGFAKAHGLAYVEFASTEEDIASIIEDARSVAVSARKEKAVARRYHGIIDATSEGIVAVDEKGRVTTINTAARKLLAIDLSRAIGKPVDHFFPDLPISGILNTRTAVYDQIKRINGHLFVFNHLPVMMDNDLIGAVSTFKDVSKVMETENEIRRTLSRGLVAKYVIEDLVHESPSMVDVVDMARAFARTDSTILVMGETGTGKEVLAQSIHNLSRRKKRPFVSVNCAALPEQLLESELFGYEEGAFTGSKKGGKPGRFEIAHKGTIFLDEIDASPRNVQIRLLRILQEREVMRVGGVRKIPIDVRVLAAAGQDLAEAVSRDRFREDLFFRLNVLRIRIPPLRERSEDIPLLLDRFIPMIARKHRLPAAALPEAYVRRLMAYEWPGNVRQLRNFSERLVLNCNLRCDRNVLDELYNELVQYPLRESTKISADGPPPLREEFRRKKIENEGRMILKALESARFCKSKAARELGISRTTLWRKMKEAGLT